MGVRDRNASLAITGGAEARTATRLLGRSVRLDPVVLTSFSTGSGAVRAILRVPERFTRVRGVILADSLHAGFVGDGAAPRDQDLEIATVDLDVFVRLTIGAAAGRIHCW